jgi:formylglycine-generating enzyme required for sulfatase activity
MKNCSHEEDTIAPKNFCIVLFNLLALTLVLCCCSVQGEPGGQSVPEIRSPRPGEVRMNPQDEERYVWIPPGDFQMGCSPDDKYCQDAG